LQLSALFQIKAQPHLQPHFMKSTLLSAVILSLAVSVFAEDKPPQLKDLKDKASYAIGLNIGFNFKKQNVDVNQDAFTAGFKDALTGRKPLLNEQEVRETMMAFEKDMQQKQAETAQKNAAESEKFLAANKTKEGVKTTASGLQYKVLKEGSGAQPKSSDTVTVNYRGTLVDGTEFDSSYKRGQPATFPVSGVIKGWTEALQLMKVGSKLQLFIPASLAYGEQGRPGLPPNSTLIFEVELMDVKPAPAGGTSPTPSPSAK
jgi:FKBP-type peptidyl-prolyl cis-trans isomerase FklB